MAEPVTFIGRLRQLNFMREHSLTRDNTGRDWDQESVGTQEYTEEMARLAVEYFALDASFSELEHMIKAAGLTLIVNNRHEPRLIRVAKAQGTA
jgi:hypothetical protein